MVVTPTVGWMLIPISKSYMRLPKTDGVKLSGAQDVLPGLEATLDNAKPLLALGSPEATKLGSKATLRVWTKAADPKVTGKQYVHFDPKTKLPLGAEFTYDGQEYVLTYRDLRVGAGLTKKDFEWTPPADWREIKQAK